MTLALAPEATVETLTETPAPEAERPTPRPYSLATLLIHVYGCYVDDESVSHEDKVMQGLYHHLEINRRTWIRRWKSGYAMLDFFEADDWAVRLGVNPINIWPEWEFDTTGLAPEDFEGLETDLALIDALALVS